MEEMVPDVCLVFRALTMIASTVEKNHSKSKRAWAIIDPRSYKSTGGAIADLRMELDQALAAFQVSALYSSTTYHRPTT